MKGQCLFISGQLNHFTLSGVSVLFVWSAFKRPGRTLMGQEIICLLVLEMTNSMQHSFLCFPLLCDGSTNRSTEPPWKQLHSFDEHCFCTCIHHHSNACLDGEYLVIFNSLHDGWVVRGFLLDWACSDRAP